MIKIYDEYESIGGYINEEYYLYSEEEIRELKKING